MLSSPFNLRLRYDYLCILVASLFWPLTYAQDTQQLQLVTENWYPFNYLAENGKIEGSSTLYLQELFHTANVTYSIDLLPWTRAMHLARTQPNVAIYTILRSPERESLFHWICPIAHKQTHRIYKLSSRTDIHLSTENELKHYSIAVTRETFLHKYMLQQGMLENRNLQLTVDDKINTTLFFGGRVDLLAEFDSNIDKVLQEAGLDKKAIEPLLQLPEAIYPEFCLAISKQTPASLVNKISQAQQSLQTK